MAKMTNLAEVGSGCSPVGGGTPDGEVQMPLTKTIRELETGKTVYFPFERLGSVRAVVSRMKLERYRERWNAIVSVDYDHLSVVVRRLM